jgi:putative hydrolase of the HAD superfamily
LTQVQCVLFDCMETLIDLKELPTIREYALWAFEGSGQEHYWAGFDEFFESYKEAREKISNCLPQYKEYEIWERLKYVTRLKLNGARNTEVCQVSSHLMDNFWHTYVSMVYVRNEVKTVLAHLSESRRLGVVSNFMVEDGIEQLLKQHGIFDYFDFVVTSIRVGWRKPHPEIYRVSIEKAQVDPGNILFLGDNYECDYLGPKKMGIRSLLLDRKGNFLDGTDRINNFFELLSLIS